MTTRKMSYTNSCKIIEMCGRLKFRKLIPEGNLLKLSCGISERLLLIIKAPWLRPQSWSHHSQTRLLFREQDKPKSFIQGSRGKTETFAFMTRVKSKTFIKRTRAKSKTFIKRTRVDSRPETLVSRSQVWFFKIACRGCPNY